MRCVRKNIPGGFIITCSRREPRAACSSCHHREHEVLCDFELGGKKAGKTCDAKLCSICALHVGTEHDLCRVHAKLALVKARADAVAVVACGIDAARALYVDSRTNLVALAGLVHALRAAGLQAEAGAIAHKVGDEFIAKADAIR